MWQLDNQTLFAADRAWARDRDGAEVWIVAVKCTFAVATDGKIEISREQPPVVRVPEHLDPPKPLESSLKYDVDLVRTKTTTDITVLGHAYAPGTTEVTGLDVGFRVGSVVKRLRVTGDRVWHGSTPSAPQPFSKMPIIYERAFGGVDPQSRDTPSPQWETRNPLGLGFTLSGKADGRPLPNIEYPDQLMQRPADRPSPAGFGPICSHWQPRSQLAGTYNDKWQQERFPLLPMDFDDRHYQCAPVDQQAPEFLKGGEEVVLVNLTPGGELRFILPRVFLGLETVFLSGERLHHDKPCLHSVILEPDFPRVSLVWHSALPCHPKVYKLDHTRIFEKEMLWAGETEDDLELEDA